MTSEMNIWLQQDCTNMYVYKKYQFHKITQSQISTDLMLTHVPPKGGVRELTYMRLCAYQNICVWQKCYHE